MCPVQDVNHVYGIHLVLIGAGERNRTPDRLITNQLLYLLSYASAGIKSTAVLLRSAIVPISATEVKLWSRFPCGELKPLENQVGSPLSSNAQTNQGFPVSPSQDRTVIRVTLL